MTAFLRFKLAIANQLSKHAPCSPKEITTLMRTPKLRKDGHISISLPKLNASLASPITNQELNKWSKDIAEKVNNNRYTCFISSIHILSSLGLTSISRKLVYKIRVYSSSFENKSLSNTFYSKCIIMTRHMAGLIYQSLLRTILS
jgi:hypothetical protein